ncbi:MAG: ATP-binding cassette domain-containing protein, partial [Gammaproteobacteria bacterium]|nr:ATP-binding cassette domain-containing protein [Gammaproteobacteria bacterium]
MITVKNLHKSFQVANKSVTAVEDVSFIAPSGAITGLLGPNGAGKTTSIRMIGSLVEIGGGSVMIDDIDVAKNPDAARETCGILTDARGLYTRLTARENIRYYAE